MYAMLSHIYRQYFKGAEKVDKPEQNVIAKEPPANKHAAALTDKHKDDKHHKDHHKTPSPERPSLTPFGVVHNSHRELIQLQQKNSQLQDFVEQSKTREAEFQNVLGDYDELFQKLVEDRKTLVIQNADAKKHLENLETAFYDLLKKYEKAKGVIQSYQENEVILQEELEHYKTLVGDVKRDVAGGGGNSKVPTYLVFQDTKETAIKRK